jgi:hypothetical protein
MHMQAAKKMLDDESELFEQLKSRATACTETLSDWDAPDWILSQTMFGVTTYYKRDPVNGSLWVSRLHSVKHYHPMFQLCAQCCVVTLAL